MAKVVIAMEEGVIPANLHFKTPNPDIPGLLNGQLKVVDTNLPWNGGLVAINSFGFGGANVHVLLKSTNSTQPKSSLVNEGLKLFSYSGRTEDSVTTVFDRMEASPNDGNLYTLLSEAALAPVNMQPYRGYLILNSKESVREIRVGFYFLTFIFHSQKNKRHE